MNALTAASTAKKNTIPARERTYALLKEKLFSGRFRPGERLTEEHLAAELGVSRTPVREALHKLEREGLIKPLARRGFCVPYDSREEMEELFEIRSILEGYALRCVCKSISEDNLACLESLIEEAEAALHQRKTDSIFKINTKFHDTLHDLICHKPRLHHLMADMRNYVLRYRKDSLHTLTGAKHAIEGHRKIMLALKLRDPDLCERVMREHIHESKVDALETTFGRG
jgi:DNA-binding GntR family transcriptional regulator